MRTTRQSKNPTKKINLEGLYSHLDIAYPTPTFSGNITEDVLRSYIYRLASELDSNSWSLSSDSSSDPILWQETN